MTDQRLQWNDHTMSSFSTEHCHTVAFSFYQFSAHRLFCLCLLFFWIASRLSALSEEWEIFLTGLPCFQLWVQAYEFYCHVSSSLFSEEPLFYWIVFIRSIGIQVVQKLTSCISATYQFLTKVSFYCYWLKHSKMPFRSVPLGHYRTQSLKNYIPMYLFFRSLVLCRIYAHVLWCLLVICHHLLWLVRLISHTKNMLNANRQNEKLCITVLQMLKEMVSVDVKFGPKVTIVTCHFNVEL